MPRFCHRSFSHKHEIPLHKHEISTATERLKADTSIRGIRSWHRHLAQSLARSPGGRRRMATRLGMTDSVDDTESETTIRNVCSRRPSDVSTTITQDRVLRLVGKLSAIPKRARGRGFDSPVKGRQGSFLAGPHPRASQALVMVNALLARTAAAPRTPARAPHRLVAVSTILARLRRPSAPTRSRRSAFPARACQAKGKAAPAK